MCPHCQEWAKDMNPTNNDSSPRWGSVFRDVLIITALTFFGGFVVGLAGDPQRHATSYILALIASNIGFGTVGFVISGCLAQGNRWRHLAYVALGAWGVGLLNVVLFGFSLSLWFLSAIFIAIIMGLGGCISFLFKKHESSA